MSSTGVLRHFVVMKCIDGEPLDIVWMRLTTEQQSNVVRQLRDMIEQLRALPPPDPFAISGLYSRKCKDHRVGGNVPFGPFKNESEFNDHLVRVSQGPFPHDPFLDETREMMCDTHRVVFTHGDFAPRNIMVKDDVVLALIDWENAGYVDCPEIFSTHLILHRIPDGTPSIGSTLKQNSVPTTLAARVGCELLTTSCHTIMPTTG